MKARDKIVRERAFDWPAFLEQWNAQAQASIAEMLLRFGVTGPPSYGIAEHVKAEAREPIPEGLLQPLEGPISAQAEIDALLSHARERLDALAAFVDLRYVVSYEWAVIRNGGLRSLPANQDDLKRVENRLGVSLPPSYNAFLKLSNGWLTSTSRLVRSDSLQRFGQKDPKYVKDWSLDLPGGVPDSDYYVYGKEQLPYNIRTDYLDDCIVIAEPLTEVNERLLLNPHVQFEDSEWEAWFMSPRLPGAIRYQSFLDLMELLRKSDEIAWRRLSEAR